jgi:hypothetical protein
MPSIKQSLYSELSFLPFVNFLIETPFAPFVEPKLHLAAAAGPARCRALVTKGSATTVNSTRMTHVNHFIFMLAF